MPLIFLSLLMFTTFYIAGQSSRRNSYDIAIHNVTVIPCHTDSLYKNKTVLIRNNRIVKIIDKKKVRAKTVIDGTDKYLIPGLADMHVHFPGELNRFMALNLRAGVLYLRSMRGDARDFSHVKFRDSLILNDPYAPSFILSAPPFFKKDRLSNIDSAIHAYKKNRYDLLKILSVRDEAHFSEIMASARKYEMKVAGHNPVDLLKTIQSGMGCIEHLDGYISYLRKDSLDFVIDKTLERDMYNCATFDWYSIAYLQWQKEGLQKRAGFSFATNLERAKWDSTYAEWMNRVDKLDEAKRITYHNNINEGINAKHRIIKRLDQKGANLILSPDATGPFQLTGFSLYEEMYHHKNAGLSNMKILQAATYNAAQYCGAKDWGSVRKGQLANLVLLARNPLDEIKNIDSVEGIIVNGNWMDRALLESRINSN